MKKNNRTVKRENLIALPEGAMMVALAVVLDLIPWPFRWPQGGSFSIGAIPIIYYSYRRGSLRGCLAGLVYAGMQMLLGFYPPPANAWWAVLLCVLLDYVLAFSVLGAAELFARPFRRARRPWRLTGYALGAVCVSLLRLGCSFLSGIILWDSYAPEGVEVWVYSLLYNAGYMLPNAAVCAVCLVLLCAAVEPHTLRPMKD